MTSNEKPSTPEQQQLTLGTIHDKAMAIIAKYPRDDMGYSSDALSVHMADEQDAGIFTSLTVTSKSSETIIDLDYTQFGNGVKSDQRKRSEQFVLSESLDGRFYLEGSALVTTTTEVVLHEASTTELDYSTAAMHDEAQLKETRKPATSADITRLAEYVELALLGKDYSDNIGDLDDIGWIIYDWENEIKGIHGSNEGNEQSSSSGLGLVKAAFRRLFKK